MAKVLVGRELFERMQRYTENYYTFCKTFEQRADEQPQMEADALASHDLLEEQEEQGPLDQIAEILRKERWSPCDDMESIAEIIRCAGLDID